MCAQALQTLTLCEELGVPIEKGKTEGPNTTLTFLGIEIDSRAMQLRLPSDKLQELSALLCQWMQGNRAGTPRRSGTKRELLLLIGLLNHAATIVRPGHTFLRSLIDASTTVRSLEHHVHLRAPARADIACWHTFLHSWNGTSLLPAQDPSQIVYSMHQGHGGVAHYGGTTGFSCLGLQRGPDCTLLQRSSPR